MLCMATETRALETQLRKGVAPYCALARIAEGPQYGYDLARALAEAGLVAGSGSVYPLLGRLKADGLVDSAWHPPADGGVPRKYYTLTPAGRAALEAFRRQWQVLAAGVERLLGAAVAGGERGGAG